MPPGSSPPSVSLSAAERERYSHQLALPGWGESAQERLASSAAIVVGAGGLGAPAAAHLAAAGVGRIGIVDHAAVEVASLHRQTLYLTPEVGTSKAEAAALKLGVLNPEVQPEPYPVQLGEMNAAAIVTGADVAVDCSNDEPTRRLLNEACCAERVPLVEAGVRGLSGFLMSIRPGESACYRCAFPTTDDDGGTDDAGAVGAMDGGLGALQGLEALKLLTGLGRPLLDRVLRLDGAEMTSTTVAVGRRSDCPACGGARAAPQSG